MTGICDAFCIHCLLCHYILQTVHILYTIIIIYTLIMSVEELIAYRSINVGCRIIIGICVHCT